MSGKKCFKLHGTMWSLMLHVCIEYDDQYFILVKSTVSKWH